MGAAPDAVYYGPWMWRQAYALTRLREGRPADVARRLKQLEEPCWRPDRRPGPGGALGAVVDTKGE